MLRGLCAAPVHGGGAHAGQCRAAGDDPRCIVEETCRRGRRLTCGLPLARLQRQAVIASSGGVLAPRPTPRPRPGVASPSRLPSARWRSRRRASESQRGHRIAGAGIGHALQNSGKSRDLAVGLALAQTQSGIYVSAATPRNPRRRGHVIGHERSVSDDPIRTSEIPASRMSSSREFTLTYLVGPGKTPTRRTSA